MSNETRRKHSIQVRLSDEEYEAFNRKFKASGIAFSIRTQPSLTF